VNDYFPVAPVGVAVWLGVVWSGMSGCAFDFYLLSAFEA
jgi:hypothetical protein